MTKSFSPRRADLICTQCGESFDSDAALVALLPLLVPKRCAACASQHPPMQPPPSIDGILSRPAEGPDSGIFVGASCEPNPGPGAWAAVRVLNGAVVRQVQGGERWTTAPRMSFQAVIEGLKMAARSETLGIYSCDQTAVMTLKSWAPAWRRNGWYTLRPRQQVKNLDLVRMSLELYEERPNVTMNWLGAASGARWCDYARAVARHHLLESVRSEGYKMAG